MSDLDMTPSPFLIATALGDGTEAEIPAADYGELTRLLERMSAACEKARTPMPATVVWRFDRGAPRPLSRAELEEGDLHALPILAG
jgi:hypothetical protein